MLKVVSLAIAMVLCAVGAAEGGAGMYFDMVDTDQNSKIDVNEIRGFMNTFGQMMVSVQWLSVVGVALREASPLRK